MSVDGQLSAQEVNDGQCISSNTETNLECAIVQHNLIVLRDSVKISSWIVVQVVEKQPKASQNMLTWTGHAVQEGPTQNHAVGLMTNMCACRRILQIRLRREIGEKSSLKFYNIEQSFILLHCFCHCCDSANEPPIARNIMRSDKLNVEISTSRSI